MSMEFGIFRRMEDKFGELLLHFDGEEVKKRLSERLLHHLPCEGKKGLLRKVKQRENWNQEEIKEAFNRAWMDTVRILKKETIRIW